MAVRSILHPVRLIRWYRRAAWFKRKARERQTYQWSWDWYNKQLCFIGRLIVWSIGMFKEGPLAEFPSTIRTTRRRDSRGA